MNRQQRLCRCGQSMEYIKKDISRSINGRSIVIKKVPALYCAGCRQTLYNSRTVKKMDQLIREHPNQGDLEYPNFAFPNGTIEFFKTLGIDSTLDDEQPVTQFDCLVLAEKFLRRPA